MAIMGRVDQMISAEGLSLTTPPFGAVCMVLLATSTALAAICNKLGGKGHFLAASVAFMIFTGYTHPPAASLPLMFIDGAKYHNLQLWYALFPGATGCTVQCLIRPDL